MIERLARLLGEPERDPHGSAIPSAEGEIITRPYTTLAEKEEGDTVRVMEVQVREPEQLRYIGSLGLYPDAQVLILEQAPFDGPLSIEVDGKQHVISRRIAERILVEENGG